MPAMAYIGPGQRQEPESQSQSPIWVTGTQILASSPSASQGAHQQEAGLELNRALIRDMHIPSGNLTTVPIYQLFIRY